MLIATSSSTSTRNRPPRRRTTGHHHPATASAYDAVDAAAAWDRRRWELDDLVGITNVLTDVERQADEINRRAAALVEDLL